METNYDSLSPKKLKKTNHKLSEVDFFQIDLPLYKITKIFFKLKFYIIFGLFAGLIVGTIAYQIFPTKYKSTASIHIDYNSLPANINQKEILSLLQSLLASTSFQKSVEISLKKAEKDSIISNDLFNSLKNFTFTIESGRGIHEFHIKYLLAKASDNKLFLSKIFINNLNSEINNYNKIQKEIHSIRSSATFLNDSKKNDATIKKITETNKISLKKLVDVNGRIQSLSYLLRKKAKSNSIDIKWLSENRNSSIERISGINNNSLEPGLVATPLYQDASKYLNEINRLISVLWQDNVLSKEELASYREKHYEFQGELASSYSAVSINQRAIELEMKNSINSFKEANSSLNSFLHQLPNFKFFNLNGSPYFREFEKETLTRFFAGIIIFAITFLVFVAVGIIKFWFKNQERLEEI